MTSASASLFQGKEYRSINTTTYEISIQKNGRTDIRFVSGLPVFDNACPQMALAGKELRIIPVNGVDTTRQTVNDRLGQGQGMLFSCREGEWHVSSYTTQPFITARFIFINRKKKPVTIEKLVPWSVAGLSGKLHMGNNANETVILENGRLFSTFNDYAEIVKMSSKSQWNLAAFNDTGKRCLVAGFLTNNHAYTQIVMEREESDSPEAFPVFRAECLYDPPVEVPPGGQLASEPIYIAFAEKDPHVALERYGKAVAVMNGIHDKRPFMPHGWDSWSTRYHTDINEEKMLANLDFVATNLKRYGWNHFAIDAGWEKGLADWEVDPAKFPHGMKFMADAIHDRGMTAGIWIDPFTIPKNSVLAAEHPDWMAEPHAMGRVVMGPDKYILDVTVPEARAYARDLASKIRNDWGFDALMEADFVYHLLLAEEYHQKNLTRIDVQHMGMAALREGFSDGFIMAMTPQPVNAVYADGLRVGRDCAPLWESGNISASWGCKESLTNAIRRYYFSPHCYVPDQDCAFFGHESSRKRWKVEDKPALTRSQSLAWLTGAALTGGVVKIGEPFVDLSPEETGILSKLLPSVERPARPVDLHFWQGERPPSIWFLPLETPAGKWYLAAFFNWDPENSITIETTLDVFGFDHSSYFTVFDFWAERYLGTILTSIKAEIAPGSVRLFGLRPYQEHPMLIAHNRHITQGAMDHTALEWNAEKQELRGTFNAVENTDYRFWILAPDPWKMKAAVLSTGEAAASQEGETVTMQFHTEASGQMTWTVAF